MKEEKCSKQKNKTLNKGFTLLELLVVVLIIGILAAIALPQYRKVVEKSRLAEPLTILPSLQKAIDIYLLTNGYPNSNYSTTFLNQNPDAYLDIDITENFQCDNYECSSKYYDYHAECSKTNCYIMANRHHSPLNYNITFLKRKDDEVWERWCQYDGDDAERLCESLEPEGFDRQCC